MNYKNPVFRLLAVAGMTATLSSCGYNIAAMSNQNNLTTQVQLGSNNYRVLDRVSGSDATTYILGIGGMGATQVHQNAYAAMMEKAGLKGGSKAVVNVITESHIGGVFPFYYTVTTNVSGDVVEFTK